MLLLSYKEKGDKKMKRLLALVIPFLLLAGCSANTAGESASFLEISQSEAMEIMDTQENFIILDVRRPDEFKEGHIKNAINIPNETIGEDEIPALPQKDQLILVYCRSGNRSKQASQKLAKLGYTNIKEFGGINTWEGEIVKD